MAQSHSVRPLVSVLLCAYDAAPVIKCCLDSIAAQSYRPLELILIDDASNDKTCRVIKQWADRHHDLTIKTIINESNLGLTRSLNRGSQAVSGQYIARIDADDIWLPDKLEKQVKYLEHHPSVGVVGSYYINIKNGCRYLWRLPEADAEIRRTIYRRNPFGHSCVVMRTDLFRSQHGYNELLRFGQDRDLWFRLMPVTRFHNITEPLCWRRADEGISITHSQAQMLQSVRTTLTYLQKHRANLINYFWLVKPLLIAATPHWLKRWYGNLIYRQPHFHNQGRFNLIYINDCFLPNLYANAVARLSMAQAFLNHPRVNQIRFYYHARDRLRPPVIQHTRLREVRLIAPYLSSPTRPTRWFNTMLYLISSLRLLYASWPNHYPIIYTRIGAYAGALVAIRLWLQPRTLLFELHNYEFGRRRLLDWLYYLIFQQASLLVTVAATTRDNWIRYGIPAQKIIVVPSGVFIDRFDAVNASQAKLRRQLKLPRHKFIIMYGGNLYRHRGIEDILTAAHHLSINTRLHFILVGGQLTDINYYHLWRQQQGFQENNLSFIGYELPARVPFFLKSADLLLVTYSRLCQTVNSMSPLKLTEALASRVPVIAPKLNRIYDIANSSMVTFYEPDNASSLTNAINFVLANPTLAANKSQRGYMTIQQMSWPHRVDKILQAVL